VTELPAAYVPAFSSSEPQAKVITYEETLARPCCSTNGKVTYRYSYEVRWGLWDSLALILGGRLRLGVNLPVLLSQGSPGTTINGVAFGGVEQATLDDLRIAADLRVAGEYGDPFTFAIGAQLHTRT